MVYLFLLTRIINKLKNFIMKTTEIIKKIEKIGFTQTGNSPEIGELRKKIWQAAMVVHSIEMMGTPFSEDMRVAFENQFPELGRQVIKLKDPKLQELLPLLRALGENLS